MKFVYNGPNLKIDLTVCVIAQKNIFYDQLGRISKGQLLNRKFPTVFGKLERWLVFECPVIKSWMLYAFMQKKSEYIKNRIIFKRHFFKIVASVLSQHITFGRQGF